MGRHELHFVEIGDFFDFRYVIESGEVLSGLCKISDPKEHEQRFTYYSLLFLIDIPEDKTHHEVDVLMAKMGLGQFRRHLPHVEHVMTTPPSFR